jgi:predicted RNA-binding protein with PIN domain
MIIVDGYNVIYKWKSLSRFVYNIELARTRLVNILSNYQGYTGEEIVIVFDSSIRESAQYEDIPQNIKVIYAPSNQGADIFIEQMVNSSTNPSDITVVTGDVLERTSVIKSGAKTKTPERFEEEVKKVCGF